ncbi:MAG: DUF4870 family protein [Steroidobacteraceae bacterium]
MDAPPAPAVTPPASADQPLRGLIDYTHWIYGLHALSVVSAIATAHDIAWRFVVGLPSIIAVIMNYARRSETRGTWLESHFRWQIRTFWFAWLWIILTVVISTPLVLVALLGVATAVLGIGLTGLWVIYRIVRGWLTLRDHRAMPLP